MSGPLEERDEQQFYASERLKDCQHMILRMAQSLVVQRARVEKARSAGLAAARDAYSDLQEVRGYLLEALSDVRPCLMEVEEYKLAAAAGQLHAGLAHFDLMSTAYKPVYDALCGFAGSLPVSGTTKAITRILRDERYTGKLIGIKTTRTELGNQKSSRKQSEEDWIVVPGTFEAIVSQETFDEAQRQLETLRRHSGKRETNTPAVHLFSRKLKCGHCGLALGRHVVDLGVYYHCERRAWNSGATCLGARLFEDDLIRTVLASIRFQARLAGKAEKRLDKLENAERRERESLWEQRRRIQMKLDHLTTQKAEAFLLFNQGDLTQKTYDAKCAKLDKTILEQRTKLLDMSGTQTGTQDGAVLHCREDIARLKELSNLRTLNRQTVEKLIQSIRVYDGKRIEIVWNFSDSYMKLLTGEEQNHEG